MPAWIPGRLLIGYLTGAFLLVGGASILLAKKTRLAATYLGAWLVLLVLFIYGPVLTASLADPSTAVKVEGINYFFDTLLFAGAILASPARRHAVNKMLVADCKALRFAQDDRLSGWQDGVKSEAPGYFACAAASAPASILSRSCRDK